VQSSSRLTSISEALRQRGFEPSSRWPNRTFSAAATTTVSCAR
jgi:hypothetical protein